MPCGPFWAIFRKAASSVSIPPMPFPRITPNRSGSTSPAFRPAWVMASRVDAIANCVNRSMRRASRDSKIFSAAKSFTSPATFES